MGNVSNLGRTSHSVASRIEAGAAAGIRYALWKMANTAFEAGDFEVALGHYEKAASLGLGLALRAVGFMRAGGIGCAADPKAAAGAYMAAADAGNGPAAFQVGLTCVYGRGVARDVDLALCFFEKAAAAGVNMAKTHLALAKLKVIPLESAGQTLLRLVEMSRNDVDNAAVHRAIGVAWLEGYLWVYVERAASAFQFAAGLGCNESKLELARLLLGSGNSADVNEAIRLLLGAAKAGVADAAAELGIIFVSGSYGLPQELDYGLEWLKRAVECGSVVGAVTLAKHLLVSDDKHDLKRSKRILVPAVEEKGCVEAAHALAYLMEKEPLLFGGDEYQHLLNLCAEMGVLDAMMILAQSATTNEGKLFWLQAAVDDGSVFAQFALGCELWNVDSRASTTEALAYFKSASNLGSLEATKTLAEMYSGAGGRVQRNLNKAAFYYAILADGGDEAAKETLADLKARGVNVTDQSAMGATVLPITGGGTL